jgi:UPF0271 protein
MYINLNCDLGEGLPNDLEILPLVGSINLACCAHAGNPANVLEVMEAAAKLDILVGAHPGYLDRANFGRVELQQPIAQLKADLLFQLGGFMELAKVANLKISHLKPHGALYHRAMKDIELANLLTQMALSWNLTLVGLKDSALENAAKGRTPFLREGFADRKYLPDGSLAPRSSPNAILHDPVEAALQVQQLIEQDQVQTICVHGDSPEVVHFIKRLKGALQELGIRTGKPS